MLQSRHLSNPATPSTEGKIPALQEAKCGVYKAHDVVKEERVSKHMQVTFAILEPHHPSRPKAVWGGECPQGPVDESTDQIKKSCIS